MDPIAQALLFVFIGSVFALLLVLKVLPKSWHVSRSVQVPLPVEQVFEKLSRIQGPRPGDLVVIRSQPPRTFEYRLLLGGNLLEGTIAVESCLFKNSTTEITWTVRGTPQGSPLRRIGALKSRTLAASDIEALLRSLK